MLDWFQGKIGYESSKLRPDIMAIVDPDGNIKYSRCRPVASTVGSYSEKLYLERVRPSEGMCLASDKYGLECSDPCLYIFGNPTKALQGHNVFGPPVGSLGPVLQAVIRALSPEVRPLNADSDKVPALHRNRVDVTTHVRFPRHGDVHNYMNFMKGYTRSRQGAPIVTGRTLYWQKHSKIWTLKMYCKHCELADHKPRHVDEGFLENLLAYTEGLLRIELTLRTPELKDKGTLNESIIWEYMNRIGVSNMSIEIEKHGRIPKLPRNVEYTFTQWLQGIDVRFVMPRQTLYRHRQLIKSETGIDVAIPRDNEPLERLEIDMEWLKAHEELEVPSQLQGYLFKTGAAPVWTAH